MFPHAGKDGFGLLNCLIGKRVKTVDQKKAVLLHTAELNVQEINFTLTEERGSDSYRKVVTDQVITDLMSILRLIHFTLTKEGRSDSYRKVITDQVITDLMSILRLSCKRPTSVFM